MRLFWFIIVTAALTVVVPLVHGAVTNYLKHSRYWTLWRTHKAILKQKKSITKGDFIDAVLAQLDDYTDVHERFAEWVYDTEGFHTLLLPRPLKLDTYEFVSRLNTMASLGSVDDAIRATADALKAVVPGEYCTDVVLGHLRCDALPKTRHATFANRNPLEGTPLIDLMSDSFPLPAPNKTYFEHMWIVGGTGVGKTQWLAQLFLRHAKHSTKPAMVFVDSQGDIIPKLQTLASIQDRVVYINPRHPPSIRLFGEGSPEIFDYLFSGILGADLTTKQGVFFRMMAKLLQSIPGATIMDMFYMMNDITPYKKHIEKLPNLPRLFFQQDFNSKTFQQTKEQVRYRLNALLENKTLELLLGESKTPLNLEKALNEGAVILIDTSKEHLKSSSAAFGRIFIALILQAIYNRASIPEAKRRPTFLIIDEAQEYFDQNIDDLLTQVRKYKCGAVFAHQYLGQCTQQLRESLAANTSIKMVSGVSAPDARALAQELRTTTDFILQQKPLTFATYIRNVTPRAISVPVTAGLLDKEKHIQFKEHIPEHTPPPEHIHTPHSQDNVSTDASQTW